MTEPKCRVCGGDDRVAPTAFAKLGSTHLCVQCIGLKSRQEIAKLFLCCDKGELLVGHLPIGAVFHSWAEYTVLERSDDGSVSLKTNATGALRVNIPGHSKVARLISVPLEDREPAPAGFPTEYDVEQGLLGSSWKISNRLKLPQWDYYPWTHRRGSYRLYLERETDGVAVTITIPDSETLDTATWIVWCNWLRAMVLDDRNVPPNHPCRTGDTKLLWERYLRCVSITGALAPESQKPAPPVEDIAHHLSMTCRYTGASSRFYSVAEHSCHVADEVIERAAKPAPPVENAVAGARHWRTSDGMYEVDGIPYNTEISSHLGNDWTLCSPNWKPLEKPLSAWSLVGHEWRLHLKHSSGRRWKLTTLREERTLTAQQHRELIFKRLGVIGDIASGAKSGPDFGDGKFYLAVYQITETTQSSQVNGSVAPGLEVAELCVKLLTSWMPCNSKWEVQATYNWERKLWKVVRSACNTRDDRLARWALHLRQADGKQLTLFHPEHEVDWPSWIDRIARGDFVELHPQATTLSEEDVVFGNHVRVNFGRSDFCHACTEVFWEGLPNVVLGDSDGAPMYANVCGDCMTHRLIDAQACARRRAVDLLEGPEPPPISHPWEAWETAFWSEP